MIYKIIIVHEKKIAKDFSKLSKKDQVLIKQKINELKKMWITHTQVKQLQNYVLADYRLRVWKYRILFDIDLSNKTIYIFRILHRSKLY